MTDEAAVAVQGESGPPRDPWAGLCHECMHPLHGYAQQGRDVRCSKVVGGDTNGPDYCLCIDWRDVLAAYRAIEAEAAAPEATADAPEPPVPPIVGGYLHRTNPPAALPIARATADAEGLRAALVAYDDTIRDFVTFGGHANHDDDSGCAVCDAEVVLAAHAATADNARRALPAPRPEPPEPGA